MQSLNNILQQQQKQLKFIKQQPQQPQQQQPQVIKAPVIKPQPQQAPVIKAPVIQPQPKQAPVIQPQPKQAPVIKEPVIKAPFIQPIKKIPSKKKSEKKSEKHTSVNPKKYPSIKKVIPDKKDKHLVELINEEDTIFNEFKTMEFNIQKLLLKPTLKYEEKIDIDVDGKKERTVIKDKDNKKKRVRRTFTGCSVQSKVTLYEKENDNDSPDDKYYEIKEIYRKCPKKISQTIQ
jgi:hypothetical protein